jgi:tetratricopeptide (TPR) repeat protein
MRTKLFSHRAFGRRALADAGSSVRGATVHHRDARRRRRRRGGEATGPAALAPDDLDRQQVLLLAVLRRAGGAPVSYADLREAGIELPASVVSELQLAGVPVQRCPRESFAEAGRGAGVRLDPARNPVGAAPSRDAYRAADRTQPLPAGAYSEAAAARARRPPRVAGGVPGGQAAPGWTSKVGVVAWRRAYNAVQAAAASGRAAAARASSSVRGRATAKGDVAYRDRTRADGGRPQWLAVAAGGRWLAVLALLAAGAAVVALVLASLGGGQGTRGPEAHRHPARPAASSTTAPSPRNIAGGAGPPAATTTTTGGQQPPASRQQPPARPTSSMPVSPTLATRLESRGHALLESARYQDAVPVLRRALAATGESLGACLEPASGTCLTYAYALYDLGRALRLSGHPAAAVPILKRRLEMDDQRSTVEAELELARQGAE